MARVTSFVTSRQVSPPRLGPSAWAMSPAIISAAARSWPVDLWV